MFLKRIRALTPVLLLLCATAQADILEATDPLAAAIRPADGMTVQQTPPDFSWPEVSKTAKYTVQLTYPDGKSKSLAAPQNYLNWNEVLPAGTYSWTVTAVDASGSRRSNPRKFTVDGESKPFLVPDMKDLAAKLKAKPHPRGLPDASALAAMAKQRESGTRQLRADVEMRTRQQLAPMPNTGSPSADEGRVYDSVRLTLNALAAYALYKEDRYYAEALRLARNLASWDPNGTTAYTRRGVNMGARHLTFALVLAYDWLHPKLDAQTKELFLRTIKARMTHMYADVIGERSRVAAQPRDSHGQVTATMVGLLATLLVGDLPEADQWLAGALPLAVNLVQPWGGDDGGFSNGTPYAIWDTGSMQPMWYVLRWASGIDLAQKSWVRNYARFLAYFNPPGTPARLFGDGHEQAMFKEQSARFGKGYTYFAPTPLGRWYAARLSGEDAMRFEFIIAPPADFSGRPPFPKGTPNSLYLPTTGWVAMHSSLEDDERVSVYFKSSPPPHGAFAHQHADQNSFVINAGGERLAIESGYYDGYKTKHWWNWLKQTRAKNAVTYDGGKGQIFFEGTDYKKMGYGRVTKFAAAPDWDLATGDATQAYDGALSKAQRSVAYLRPGLIVVHDKLASATPRKWEWNIHALNRMNEISSSKVKIEKGNQSLCVEMLAGPPVRFAQTSDWVAPEPQKGDGRLFTGAEPAKGEAQWHGRFSSEPLPAAEFVFLLNVGCSGDKAVLRKDDGGNLAIEVKGRLVRIAADGDVSVQ
jgi:hypothetical protein